MKKLFNMRYKIAYPYYNKPLDWWCFDVAVGAIVSLKTYQTKSALTCSYDEFIKLADKFWQTYPDKTYQMILEILYDKKLIKSSKFSLMGQENIELKDINGRTISLSSDYAAIINGGIDYYNYAIHQYSKDFSSLKRHVKLFYPNIIKSINLEKENIIFKFQFR